jgi:hypothetical protein
MEGELKGPRKGIYKGGVIGPDFLRLKSDVPKLK